VQPDCDARQSHAPGEAEQVGGDEPPPRLSAQRRSALRERIVRPTVPVGGGRSPLALAISNENPRH